MRNPTLAHSAYVGPTTSKKKAQPAARVASIHTTPNTPEGYLLSNPGRVANAKRWFATTSGVACLYYLGYPREDAMPHRHTRPPRGYTH